MTGEVQAPRKKVVDLAGAVYTRFV
jgi:hypothetical protein